MDHQLLGNLIRHLERIEPMPSAATRMLSLTDSNSVQASVAAEILSSDQALAARVLKIANSSTYGLSRQVGTVTEAVVIIGFKGLRELVAGVAVQKYFHGTKEREETRKILWSHSLAVGCMGKMICRRLHHHSPEQTFLAGLLHDIGRAVFQDFMPEKFKEAKRLANVDSVPLHIAEKHIFGRCHTEVARELCSRWLLPDYLISVCSQHHDLPFSLPLSQEDEIRASVNLADTLVRIAGFGWQVSPVISLDSLDLLFSDLLDDKAQIELSRSLFKELSRYEALNGTAFPEVPRLPPLQIPELPPRPTQLLKLFLIGQGHLVQSSGPTLKVNWQGAIDAFTGSHFHLGRLHDWHQGQMAGLSRL
jgi:putative nucleotidyltransferase with HDIG domain